MIVLSLLHAAGALKTKALRRRWASKLRENKAALIEALQPPEPAAVDWRELDRAYQLHHINCPTCIAAGRGARYGLRCGAGAALWSAYSAQGP